MITFQNIEATELSQTEINMVEGGAVSLPKLLSRPDLKKVSDSNVKSSPTDPHKEGYTAPAKGPAIG